MTDESQTYTVTLWDEGGNQAREFSLSRGGDGKVHFESRGLASTRGPDTGPRLVAEGDISHLVEVLGAEPSIRMREALSWRLMAELARRHPKQLRVIEAHGGGGQYDELRLYPRPTPPNAGSFISLNRLGSCHFGRVQQEAWRSIWFDAVAARDLQDIVDELDNRSGLVNSSDHKPGTPLPPCTPAVLTIRAIAWLLAPMAFEHDHWSCLSGNCDTSGMGGGVRSELFEAFPLVQARLRERAGDDMLDEPAYRFWFILRNQEPRLALEENGLVWDRHGEQVNLVSRRRAAGSLRRAVPELAARL